MTTETALSASHLDRLLVLAEKAPGSVCLSKATVRRLVATARAFERLVVLCNRDIEGQFEELTGIGFDLEPVP